jgi:hypothetical protein
MTNDDLISGHLVDEVRVEKAMVEARFLVVKLMAGTAKQIDERRFFEIMEQIDKRQFGEIVDAVDEISRNERREPPWLAESLLCIFARAKDIEALMGDFEELFARDCASGMSKRRASARYWARVLRSIGPQMWQAIRRVGLLGLIAAALRR